VADACSCMVPDINRSYDHADDVVKARIFGELFFSRSGHKWYVGAVGDTFKGCLDQGQLIIVETRSDSAACGMFIRKDTYLLNGRDKGTFWGIPILGVGLCDYNKTWDSLTAQDFDYLYSRYNCCGDECICTDGTVPVNCFVDPCMFSKCADPDATCSANYCGGCRAEWYDPWGGVADCASSCDPAVEKSCNDDEHVCMAETIEETGMCQPFEHGTTVGAGYKCGGSIGVSCAEGLSCEGLPVGMIGGSGICTLVE